MEEPSDPAGCWLCQEDPDEDMERCSDCSKRFHVSCIGFKRDAVPPKWLCTRCVSKAKQVETLLENARIAQEENERLKAENNQLNNSISSQSTLIEQQLDPKGTNKGPNKKEEPTFSGNADTGSAEAQGLNETVKVLQSIKDEMISKKSDAEIRYARDIGDSIAPYDGKSKTDWLRFITQFEAQTEEFEFDNAYNMRRLRKKVLGLGGKLIENYHLPSDLEEAMEVLKEHFGEPEALKRDIKREIIESIKLATGNERLITMAIQVGRYVSAIKCAGIKGDIEDEEFIASILDHVSKFAFRKWIDKRRERREAMKNAQERRKIDPRVIVPGPLNLLDLKRFLRVAYENETEFEVYRPKESKPKDSRPAKRDSVITVQVNKPESYAQAVKAKTGKPGKGSQKKATPVATPTPASAEKKKRWDYTCAFCKQRYHTGEQCHAILGVPVDQRWKIVSDNSLCHICLMGHHRSATCRSEQNKCTVPNCGKPHHPLLHRESGNYQVPVTGTPPRKEEPREARPPTVALHSVEQKRVIYGQIPVTIENPDTGFTEKGWAYLDNGSGVTLLDHAVYQRLRLRGVNRPLTKKWTNNVTLTDRESCVTSINLIGPNGVRHSVDGVRTNQNMELPGQSKTFDPQDYEHLKDLPVYDYKGETPILLLSMVHIHLMVASEHKMGTIDEPMASNTPLGWVYMGCFRDDEDDSPRRVLVIYVGEEEGVSLNRVVQNYFDTENFGVVVPQTLRDSDEDERAERVFDKTHAYRETRNQPACSIGMPWRHDIVQPDPADVYLMAYGRLLSLERRLAKDKVMKLWMVNTIRQHVEKGYARILTAWERAHVDAHTSYVPIFYVHNPNKPNPKPRLVYDFAAETNGISINHCLLKGKDRNPHITQKVAQFRVGKIGVCGDIQEMYHRIFMNEEDVNSQRFLWRDCDTSREPDVYVLQVLAFGPVCAPSAAVYVKNRNAERLKDRYPRAHASIITDYVDNSMESYHQVQDAIDVTNEIIEVNWQANFKTRDFISNSQEVVSNITPGHTASAKEYHLADEEKTEKLLGIQWDVKNDCFIFRFSDKLQEITKKGKVKVGETPTKAEALSLIASIYDPLGWLSHITIQGRIILQDVWRSGIGWKDRLQPGEAEKWTAFINQLYYAATINIPRCYFPNAPYGKFEIHVLCDASEKAFAAVMYLECIEPQGLYDKPVLIAAKSRVAPLKALSVARLELQAAVLGTRLHTMYKRYLVQKGMDISGSTFYSDSEVVLGWINSDHRRYNVFVAHRVSEILESTTKAQWCYVNTADNTADEATKVTETNRWFFGPRFLDKSCEEDYVFDRRRASEAPLPEEEARRVMTIDPVPEGPWRIEDYSTWERIRKHVAIYRRYVAYLRTPKAFRHCILKEPLRVDDFLGAEMALCRKAQKEAYPDEWDDLSNGRPLQKQSSIRALTPYFDPMTRLIRSDSRIKQGVPYEQGHPIILPRKHAVTKLLVDFYHRECLHIKPDTQIAKLRLKYHITSVREAVKAAQNNCQKCRNARARVQHPQMAALPWERLQPHVKPFTHCGVDMFGPYNTKLTRKISIKRFGIIFTCFSTRAIHLELAENASTDAFLTCMMNMMARRGGIACLYSDQGTNFVGAETEIRNRCRNLNIDFRRNYPLSPHWGGTWESLIKSVKEAMTRMMEHSPPTDLQLAAFLIRAEAFVNSRPLVEIPLEHAGDDFLTPNHFLLGVGGGVVESFPYSDSSAASQKQYNRILAKAAEFWKIWIERYLPTLTKRVKWQQPNRPLKVGDVVVIVDETAPCQGWRKGQVVKLMPTRGDVPRAATVFVDQKYYQRPVTKLIVLDVRRDEPESPEDDQGLDQAIGGSLRFDEPIASSTRVPKMNLTYPTEKGVAPSTSRWTPTDFFYPPTPTISMSSAPSLADWDMPESVTGGSPAQRASTQVTGGSQVSTTERMTPCETPDKATRSQDKAQSTSETYTISTRSTDRSRPVPVHVCSHEEAIDFMANLSIYSREPTPEPREEEMRPFPVPDLPGHYEERERRLAAQPPRRPKKQQQQPWKRYYKPDQAEKENHKYQNRTRYRKWPKRAKKQLNFNNEENVQASRPTRYRSGFAWSNMVIPIVMVFTYFLANVSGAILRPVSDAGFLMTKVSEAYAETGTMKWTLETGVDLKQDKIALKGQLDQLDQVCTRIKVLSGKTKCQQEAWDLRKMLDMSRVSSRQRRWEGILRQLWSVFLGSDDHSKEIEAMRERQKSLELHTKNTMTITAKTLMQSENATQAKMTKFVATLNHAVDRINELESHFGSHDPSDLVEVGEDLVDAFLVHFTEMKTKYERFENIKDMLTLEEVETNLHLMRSRLLPETILPPLTTEETIGIMETYINFVDGPLQVNIFIPIVFHERFDMVRIIPIPQPTTGIVAAMDPQTVCFNNVTATYFYVTDAHSLVHASPNVTLIKNTAFKSAKQETDCLICHLFERHEDERKKCTNFTNVWKDKRHFTKVLAMPQTNQFLIMTSEPQRVTIQCAQDYRTLVPQPNQKVSTTLVTLFAGCKIHTPFGFIMANSTVEMDTNFTTIYFSRMQIPEAEYLKWNRTHKLHHVAITGTESYQQLKDEIAHMGNNLEGEESGPEWTNILVISIPTMFALIILTAAIGLLYYYKYRKAPTKANLKQTEPNPASLAGSFKAKRRLSVPSKPKRTPQTFDME